MFRWYRRSKGEIIPELDRWTVATRVSPAGKFRASRRSSYYYRCHRCLGHWALKREHQSYPHFLVSFLPLHVLYVVGCVVTLL